ncbi:MAG: prepilin-type N-terminal cleavage/methylation domain-containing protein [Verrucomicrobia bacterium]|nr:prepilin-type N-terminal cleavage/methylation domain-containing protein [Pseudomonadota bacterium]NBS78968.1 prepilin-type N-terminal cleavage/methylation domain-containing protein [bacterium]NBT23449.1 prepilin-type N-terminal cleavage/methylation domain-containing protein [bacterium]NBY65909.1 prepilin-type N-terminal cleavage/methylation domain-containing protein [Verrucomicrobiota bacterium]
MLPAGRPLRLDRMARLFPGFTLVELLTVIAIVGLVAGLAVVATGKARAAALAAKDLANLRQTASLVLITAGMHGKIPGKPGVTDNWIRVVDEYIPNTYAKNGVDPNPQDPNHVYLCPSLFALRPAFARVNVRHQWAMNQTVAERPLTVIERPAKVVLLTTALWGGPNGGWGRLEFEPSERANPDFPYPSRRLSLTDPTGTGPPDRTTLMAFVDGHVERISFRDTNYFPVNAAKPAWTP